MASARDMFIHLEKRITSLQDTMDRLASTLLERLERFHTIADEPKQVSSIQDEDGTVLHRKSGMYHYKLTTSIVDSSKSTLVENIDQLYGICCEQNDFSIRTIEKMVVMKSDGDTVQRILDCLLHYYRKSSTGFLLMEQRSLPHNGSPAKKTKSFLYDVIVTMTRKKRNDPQYVKFLLDLKTILLTAFTRLVDGGLTPPDDQDGPTNVRDVDERIRAAPV